MTLLLYGQFTASKLGKTGLTVLIDVDRITRSTGAVTSLVTGSSASITMRRGVYGYLLANADLSLYDYVGTLYTTDATVDQKEIAAMQTDWSITAIAPDNANIVAIKGIFGTMTSLPAWLSLILGTNSESTDTLNAKIEYANVTETAYSPEVSLLYVMDSGVMLQATQAEQLASAATDAAAIIAQLEAHAGDSPAMIIPQPAGPTYSTGVANCFLGSGVAGVVTVNFERVTMPVDELGVTEDGTIFADDSFTVDSISDGALTFNKFIRGAEYKIWVDSNVPSERKAHTRSFVVPDADSFILPSIA